MENNIYDISDMHDDAISLCDKYDFLASVCIGGCAGAIDVFFVGEPGFSKLGKATDKAVDNIVMRFAKAVGWSPKDGRQCSICHWFFGKQISCQLRSVSYGSSGTKISINSEKSSFKIIGTFTGYYWIVFFYIKPVYQYIKLCK